MQPATKRHQAMPQEVATRTDRDGPAHQLWIERAQLAAIFDPPLDEGIRLFVECLNAAGVETFESCEGGAGHAYREPTVRFHGDRAEGYRAVSIALRGGFKVAALRRTWPLLDGELTGPWWELTLIGPAG
ncbi:MAG: hypothetical protein J0H00_19700 [Burkholderiales bacterium]|nr:hypothetical protein [Burkholderiales bacterium]